MIVNRGDKARHIEGRLQYFWVFRICFFRKFVAQ